MQKDRETQVTKKPTGKAGIQEKGFPTPTPHSAPWGGLGRRSGG